MAYLNKVMLMGNMGKDADILVTTQGRKKASFSLATTRRYRDASTHELKDQTEWHSIVAWGPLAERIEKLQLRKGTSLYVEGRIASHEYTDQNGVKRRVTEVFLENFEFLQTKSQGSSYQGGYGGQESQGSSSQGGYQNSGYQSSNYQPEASYDAPPPPPQNSYASAPPPAVDDEMPF